MPSLMFCLSSDVGYGISSSFGNTIVYFLVVKFIIYGFYVVSVATGFPVSESIK